MPLEPEDLRRLIAAEGFLELGMFLDADAEVDHIAAEGRQFPEVMEVRARIYYALGRWGPMRVVAKTLVRTNPDSVRAAVLWAFAIRRTDSLPSAYLILLEAVDRHPEAAILHYNLACYECQLGGLEVARGRLRHAIKLDKKFGPLAVADEDLKPLWDAVGG